MPDTRSDKYMKWRVNKNITGHGRKEALAHEHTFCVFAPHMYTFNSAKKAVHYSIPKSIYG